MSLKMLKRKKTNAIFSKIFSLEESPIFSTIFPTPIVDTPYVSNGYLATPFKANFIRATTAWSFDSSGTLQSFASGVPRENVYRSDGQFLGLLMEEARTNSIRNNTMAGAGAGVLPNIWVGVIPGNSLGLTTTSIGTGTIRGMTYFDFRVSGTTSSGGVYQFAWETSTGVTAATAQSWCNSAFLALVGGNFTNVNTIKLAINENTSGGAFVSASSGSDFMASITSSILRFQNAHTTAGGATVARIQPFLAISINNGVAVDFTLRMVAPQLERGSSGRNVATSPILTSSAAVTRNGDTCKTPLTSCPFRNADFSGTWMLESLDNGWPIATLDFITGESNAAEDFSEYWQLTHESSAVGRMQILSTFSSATVFQVSYSPGTYQKNKCAWAMQLNNSAASFNGSTPTTDTTHTLVRAVNIFIGARFDGLGCLSGIINLSYRNERVSNNNLIIRST